LYFRTAQTRAGRSLLAGSQHEQNIYIGIVLAAAEAAQTCAGHRFGEVPV